MRTRITALILVTLIASGCAYTNSGDAEDLADLASKEDQSQYNIEYNFSMQGTALLGETSEDAELFARNGETRFDRKTVYAQGSTLTSIYNMENSKALRCTESNYIGNSTSQRECNVTNATVSRYIEGTEYSNPDYSVNYVREERYAGRKCKLYRIGLPPSAFESSPVINTGAIVDLCLDREKGYVAYNSMNLTRPVNSGGESVSSLYTLEAKNYSANVTGEEVKIPEFNRTEGNTTESNSTET